MTRAEQLVYQKLIADGYEVINRGWPDLLARKDGRVRAIEVKTGADFIRPHQAKCHTMLHSVGLPVEVAYVKYPERQKIVRTAQKNPRKYFVKEPTILLAPDLTREQIARSVDTILLRVIPQLAQGPVTFCTDLSAKVNRIIRP